MGMNGTFFPLLLYLFARLSPCGRYDSLFAPMRSRIRRLAAAYWLANTPADPNILSLNITFMKCKL